MTCQDGVDLNGGAPMGDPSGFASAGGHDERGQDTVRAGHRLPTLDQFPAHRRSLWRRPPGADTELRRAVPLHGLRATDLPRKPARHRNLPVRSAGQAVSHGLSLASQSLHLGRCQREPRLAYLRRLRASAHCPGAQALRPGQSRNTAGQHGLRPGCHDRGSVVCRSFPGRCFAPPRRR